MISIPKAKLPDDPLYSLRDCASNVTILMYMKKKSVHHHYPMSGKLILIGGAESRATPCKPEEDTILKQFISLCGKTAVIEIITTASTQDTLKTFHEYQQCFIAFGAKSCGHILTSPDQFYII